MRAVGRGTRSIDVVYHQNGTASRKRTGNDRMMSKRSGRDGFSAAVASLGDRSVPVPFCRACAAGSSSSYGSEMDMAGGSEHEQHGRCLNVNPRL